MISSLLLTLELALSVGDIPESLTCTGEQLSSASLLAQKKHPCLVDVSTMFVSKKSAISFGYDSHIHDSSASYPFSFNGVVNLSC